MSLAARQQVLKSHDLSSVVFNLMLQDIVKSPLLLNEHSSGHEVNEFPFVFFARYLFTRVKHGFRYGQVFKSNLEIIIIKHFRQVRGKLDPVCLTHKLDFRRMSLQPENLVIDFILKGLSFSEFNLAFLFHLFCEVVLVNEQIILSLSVLDGLGDFRKHVFYVTIDEELCGVSVWY